MLRHYRHPILACVVLFFIVGYLLLTDDKSHIPHVILPIFSHSALPLDFLNRASRNLSLDLSPSIIYSRRCIEPLFSSNIDRQEVVNISEPLIVDPVTINLDQADLLSKRLVKCTPIQLSVPNPYPVKEKFPHLMFGLATTYQRLQKSFASVKHWSAGRDSKIIVIVGDWDEQAEDVLELEREYQDNGIQASFIKPLNASHTMSQSHFMVLTQMVKASGPETKWFGLLDDDTFFPHLKPLSDALGHLDHRRDMYVGALAEDFGSIKNFGLMAYGGAGAYLSVHLANKLGDMGQATTCIQEAPSDLGDIILRDCVYHYTKAKLTILPGLYQQDLLNDLSGFFESGVEPLNLHHWKSWYEEPVVKMAITADFCGNCFLQRWRFGADTVFSNGYSIVTYRNGLENIDLEKMEHTWGQVYNDRDPQYDFTIGPLREKIKDGEKKSYKLVDAEISKGVLHQLYLWKGNHDARELDEVIELVWEN